MKISDNGRSNQRKRRDRIVFACIIYLLIVVLIMTPVTLSGYVSTASGSDSARVAKFSLDADVHGEYDPQSIGAVQLIPGEASVIKFVVTSDTEVTMDYKLTVFTEGGLPYSSLDLTCEAANGTGIQVTGLEAGLEYDGGVMALGENTHTYTLTINVPNGIDAKYSGELQSFYVYVDAVQVD